MIAQNYKKRGTRLRPATALADEALSRPPSPNVFSHPSSQTQIIEAEFKRIQELNAEAIKIDKDFIENLLKLQKINKRLCIFWAGPSEENAQKILTDIGAIEDLYPNFIQSLGFFFSLYKPMRSSLIGLNNSLHEFQIALYDLRRFKDGERLIFDLPLQRCSEEFHALESTYKRQYSRPGMREKCRLHLTSLRTSFDRFRQDQAFLKYMPRASTKGEKVYHKVSFLDSMLKRIEIYFPELDTGLINLGSSLGIMQRDRSLLLINIEKMISLFTQNQEEIRKDEGMLPSNRDLFAQMAEHRFRIRDARIGLMHHLLSSNHEPDIAGAEKMLASSYEGDLRDLKLLAEEIDTIKRYFVKLKETNTRLYYLLKEMSGLRDIIYTPDTRFLDFRNIDLFFTGVTTNMDRVTNITHLGPAIRDEAQEFFSHAKKIRLALATVKRLLKEALSDSKKELHMESRVDSLSIKGMLHITHILKNKPFSLL